MQTIAETWIEEGREEGREEGLAKGRILTLQEAVLNLLAIRFGDVGEEITTAVQETEDSAQLEKWFTEAATAVSLAAFRESLPPKRG